MPEKRGCIGSIEPKKSLVFVDDQLVGSGLTYKPRAPNVHYVLLQALDFNIEGDTHDYSVYFSFNSSGVKVNQN